MTNVYLSLGSNKGDRLGYIQQATSLLGATEGVAIVQTSAFYETEPWGCETNNWFVNAIVEIQVSLSPHQLLAECQRIEKQLGRNRQQEGHYGDRTIDIDILFFGDEIIDDANLTVPHRCFHQRAFTMVPMLELAPEFVHPQLNKTVMELYEDLENPEMIFLYGTRVDI
jgi:2-amino-4-hydroxy-6-hydroxymethyldihydropteridine diphosphokinase